MISLAIPSSAHSFAYAASAKMRATVDLIVTGKNTYNGGNQVWFGTGTVQSSQADMCHYRRFRIAITYAEGFLPVFPTTRCFLRQP